MIYNTIDRKLNPVFITEIQNKTIDEFIDIILKDPSVMTAVRNSLGILSFASNTTASSLLNNTVYYNTTENRLMIKTSPS